MSSIGWVNSDTTGAVDNEESCWFHPPRHNQYKILELAPFPRIEYPLYVDKTYTRILFIGEGWGDISNTKVVWNYKEFQPKRHPIITLQINTDKWICPAKFSSLQKWLEESGEYEQLRELETDFTKLFDSHPDFSFANFDDNISKRDGKFVLYYGASIDLPQTNYFFERENLNKISMVATEIYKLSIKISDQLMTADS